MSAEKPHNEFIPCVDLLPDELIGEILRHATWVPYGVDPSDMVYKNLQSSRYKDVAREYRSSLVTRRYLIRVCKKWYHLALPYLYERILASRLRYLEGIVQAVERLLSNESSTQVGWFARRLDIDLRSTGAETKEQREREETLVLRLLRAATNLQVLVVGNCYSRSWIDVSVSHTYCPKLEFLNWMSERDIFDPMVWAHFIHSHPNLVAIHPCAIDVPSLKTITRDQPTHSLRALTTSFTSAIPISTTFTSLERINLNLYNLYFAWDHFFEHQMIGPLPNLTTLQINFTIRDRREDLTFSLDRLQHLFPFLPNLRRIDLVLPVWPQVWSRAIFPSTITVLGFRVRSVKPNRRLVRWLLNVLNFVVKVVNPALRVQFLDENTMAGVCMHREYVVRNAEVGEVLETWLDPDGNEYKLRI